MPFTVDLLRLEAYLRQVEKELHSPVTPTFILDACITAIYSQLSFAEQNLCTLFLGGTILYNFVQQ
jgi:hypothetical protein